MKCKRCHRHLKTDKSKFIGYGPVCEKIINNLPYQQTEIIDYIKKGDKRVK